MSHAIRKPVYAICKQQRCRSACASAQSDQGLCYSLHGKHNTHRCYIQNLLCSWARSKPQRQVFLWHGTKSVTQIFFCFWIRSTTHCVHKSLRIRQLDGRQTDSQLPQKLSWIIPEIFPYVWYMLWILRLLLSKGTLQNQQKVLI